MITRLISILLASALWLTACSQSEGLPLDVYRGISLLSDSSVKMPFNAFKGIALNASVSRVERSRLAAVVASYARSEMDSKSLIAEKDATISEAHKLRSMESDACTRTIEQLSDENGSLKRRPTRLKAVLLSLASAVVGYGVGRSGIIQSIRIR
jgi:hypothetical protein